jgi:hypothetical protein
MGRVEDKNLAVTAPNEETWSCMVVWVKIRIECRYGSFSRGVVVAPDFDISR